LSAFERALRVALDTTVFLVMIYLTYVCMYLAPTGRIRHWGAATWLILFRLGPDWRTENTGLVFLGATQQPRCATTRPLGVASGKAASPPAPRMIPEVQTQEA
jgi:hypothetical protein